MGSKKTSMAGIAKKAEIEAYLSGTDLPAVIEFSDEEEIPCGDPLCEEGRRIGEMLQDVNTEAEDFLTAIAQNPDGFLGWMSSTLGHSH